jgi:D-glycero-alpha-D-manno-heptose-7-phosphate kinase
MAGGGSDYPEWFMAHGGAVLSATIEKYCYISACWLPQFYSCVHRIVWSHVETPQTLDDIEHPAVRATLKFLGFDDRKGVEIHHRGDLPARSGMGSSSAFVVGLLLALKRLQDGETPGPRWLAEQAIKIEHDILKEHVGWQDQIACAYGGLNHILFEKGGGFEVRPLQFSLWPELEARLMLVWTGVTRTASEVAETIVRDIAHKEDALNAMHALVADAVRALLEARLNDFGALLAEGWQLKKEVGDVTNPKIDELYHTARKAGALGGKLLGAGRGGFMLLYVPEQRQAKVRRALDGCKFVPVLFSHKGAEVVYSD